MVIGVPSTVGSTVSKLLLQPTNISARIAIVLNFFIVFSLFCLGLNLLSFFAPPGNVVELGGGNCNALLNGKVGGLNCGGGVNLNSPYGFFVIH